MNPMLAVRHESPIAICLAYLLIEAWREPQEVLLQFLRHSPLPHSLPPLHYLRQQRTSMHLAVPGARHPIRRAALTINRPHSNPQFGAIPARGGSAFGYCGGRVDSVRDMNGLVMVGLGIHPDV